MIGRALMRLRSFRRAVVWLAGHGPHQREPSLESMASRAARIAELAERLQGRGYSAISSLAAAEAVVIGEYHGILFERVEYDEDMLRWEAVYETRPGGPIVRLPLVHATEATQRGVASLN